MAVYASPPCRADVPLTPSGFGSPMFRGLAMVLPSAWGTDFIRCPALDIQPASYGTGLIQARLTLPVDWASGPVDDHVVETPPGYSSGPVLDHVVEKSPGFGAGPSADHIVEAVPTYASGPISDTVLSALVFDASGPVADFILISIPSPFDPLNPNSAAIPEERIVLPLNIRCAGSGGDESPGVCGRE